MRMGRTMDVDLDEKAKPCDSNQQCTYGGFEASEVCTFQASMAAASASVTANTEIMKRRTDAKRRADVHGAS